MSVREKAKHILVELAGHMPFTALGALLGIFFLLVFKNVSGAGSHSLFSAFHPGHVVLSAMVTASMFKLHAAKKRFLLVLIVGYFGSVGIATLSDVVIPHIGAHLLGLDVPTHVQLHHRETASTNREKTAVVYERGERAYSQEIEHHERKIHLGFIEEWYIVNPAALLGVFIAYFLPRTKFPHAGHVLISTWASSSYLLMNMRSEITVAVAIGIFATLFIAVWLPCCISDIVFPLLFVKSDLEKAGSWPVHARHNHPHIHKQVEDRE